MKLAAVGDNCIDVYSTGEAYPGGNPVNVAVYFTRMGGNASYTGTVGTDEYGVLMKKALSEKGVDISTVNVKEGTTAISHVELVNGDRVFGEYDEGVMADFSLSPSQLEYLASQELVVTALWGHCHGYLARIRAGGALIAYDAATRPESVPAQTALPSTDYFFFSAENGDCENLRELMKKLQAAGPVCVVATLGSAGSIAYDGNEFIKFGIIPCPVVDTMGAGDSYIAGFLKGISDGCEIPECMRMGAECAGVTIGYNGAW